MAKELDLSILAREALIILEDNIEIKPSLSMLEKDNRDTTKDLILNIQSKKLSSMDMSFPLTHIVKPVCLLLAEEINKKYKRWGFIQLELDNIGQSSMVTFEGLSIRLRQNHSPDENNYTLDIDVGLNPKRREFIIKEFKNDSNR